jgi:hypothetical protein
MNTKEERKEIQKIMKKNSWLKEINNRINRLTDNCIFDKKKIMDEKISPEQIIDIHHELDQMDDEICNEANKLEKEGINTDSLEVECSFVRSLRGWYVKLFEIKYPEDFEAWRKLEEEKVIDDMDLSVHPDKLEKWGIKT